MKLRNRHILLAVVALLICMIPFRAVLRRPVIVIIQRVRGKKTVAERVEQYGDVVRTRLAPEFERIGVTYPPQRMALVGIKKDAVLEVWVSDPPRLLKTYPILAASGELGPKLNEGDMQVPEGLYGIESLNPNSMFHLALRVNYPNAFDQTKGTLDGRTDLGCDIMIHGNTCSVGCLAMGDDAAEELFVLAAETGLQNVSVILTPADFRKEPLPTDIPAVPTWTTELYTAIKTELAKLQE